MSRFIRWQGLLTFTAIISVILVFVYLFAETLVKKGIEQGTSIYTGAEVNLEKVSIYYSPLSITLDNFQATDKNQPSHNLVSFSQAKAGVDIWEYLFGKVIIEDLAVEGLSFNNQRKTPGDVYQDKDSVNDEDEAQSNKLLPKMDVSLPDPKTLLNDSNLQTVKLAQALESSFQVEKTKILALKEKLPSKKQLKAYEKKIKALSKTKVKTLADVQKIKADYDKIKKQFKADKKVVKQAKEELLASKKRLSSQVKALKNAPEQDWKNIEKTYQLDKVDMEDFAHILFGNKAREYYQTAEVIYEHIKPFLAKSGESSTVAVEEHIGRSGRFVYFEEETPLPAFLVKHGKISMNLPQGDFLIGIEELTHQHWLRGKVTELTFNSNNLLNSGNIHIDSQFELEKNGEIEGEGKWSLADLTIEESSLRETDNVTLVLTKGTGAGNGAFAFTDTEINSQNHLELTNAIYRGDAKTHLGGIIIDTFKEIKNLSVEIQASGDISDPKLAISSPLDKLLKNAFQQQLKQKLASFKGDVEAGLNKKLAKSLKLNKTQSSELLDVEALFTDTENSLANLMKSDVVKQKQKELEDKLKDKVEDKLKKKLGKLFG